jgi:hypothetical protein
MLGNLIASRGVFVSVAKTFARESAKTGNNNNGLAVLLLDKAIHDGVKEKYRAKPGCAAGHY